MKVMGLDTDGVIGLGAITGGKLKFEFAGKDGKTYGVFVPMDSVPALVANLIAFYASATKATGQANQMATEHMLGIVKSEIASDDQGSQYAMALTTRDGLELRYLLSPEVAEGIATGLSSSLQAHGRVLPLLSPGGSRH